MAGEMNRNARCHCGSGKKFKNCHGMIKNPMTLGTRRIPVRVLVGAFIVVAVIGFLVLQNRGGGAPGAAPPGKYWSEEHGHWHDLP
jgi:hypothetical protein